MKHKSSEFEELRDRALAHLNKVVSSVLVAAGLGFSSIAHADELDDLLSKVPSKQDPRSSAVAGSNDKSPSLSQAETLVSLASGSSRLSAEQVILADHIEKKNWDQALFQYRSAFPERISGSAVQQPALITNSKALQSYLLFKNGLELYAVEKLLKEAQPSLIGTALSDLIKELVPDTSDVWNVVNPQVWKPEWTAFFGIGTEMRIKGRQLYSVNQIDEIKDLIKKTTLNTRERAWLTWQLILAQAQADDVGPAGKALALLMKMPNNPVGQDLMTLTAARMLFQSGFLDAALKYYKMVPKSSDDWFEAQEEMGWTYIRKAQPQDAIATSKSLAAKEFRAFVGPETFFMTSLAMLKVCDYQSVYQNLMDFKARYRERSERLSKLSAGSAQLVPEQQLAIKTYFEKARTRNLKLTELGRDADWLPRFVTRDEVLLWLIRTANARSQEAELAKNLHQRSVSGGSEQVGFQKDFAELSAELNSVASAAEALARNRLADLASDELSEIKTTLSKMHIVEAEMLQQITLVTNADSSSGRIELQLLQKAGTTGSQGQDRLRFPMSGLEKTAGRSERWFDEYANFKVDVVRGCAAPKSAGAKKQDSKSL